MAARVRQVTGRTAEEFDLVIDHGTPYAAFLASAEDWGADLIIVGSQGNTCASEFPLGTMARQVLRHAHCAVLVTRQHKGTRQIVAGTDFSDPSMPALKAAAGEARRTGDALTVVHCVDLLWPPSMQPTMSAPGAPTGLFEDGLKEMERASKEKLDAALKELDIDARARVTVGQAAPDLLEVATHMNANLLVVGTLGRTGLRRALLGSVAEAVATNAPCSVLVVRLKA